MTPLRPHKDPANLPHPLRIFCNKNLDSQTFEKVSAGFQKKFNKNDYLTRKDQLLMLLTYPTNPSFILVGQLLLILIRQGDSPLPTKLSGYYVLADLFKSSGQPESPFMPALITCFEANADASNTSSAQMFSEKFFLGQLLVNGTKDLGKQTPAQIAHVDLDFMMNFINDVARNKLPTMKRSLNLPVSVQAALPTVIPGT